MYHIKITLHGHTRLHVNHTNHSKPLAKPRKTTPNYAKPRQTTRNYAKPRETTRNHAKPRETTRNQAKLRKTTRNHAKLRERYMVSGNIRCPEISGIRKYPVYGNNRYTMGNLWNNRYQIFDDVLFGVKNELN